MGKQTCLWTYEDLDDYWDTACGEAFTMTEGNLVENHMRFCPFCGKPIQEVGYGEDSEAHRP